MVTVLNSQVGQINEIVKVIQSCDSAPIYIYGATITPGAEHGYVVKLIASYPGKP